MFTRVKVETEHITVGRMARALQWNTGAQARGYGWSDSKLVLEHEEAGYIRKARAGYGEGLAGGTGTSKREHQEQAATTARTDAAAAAAAAGDPRCNSERHGAGRTKEKGATHSKRWAARIQERSPAEQKNLDYVPRCTRV
eukprot:1160915-Pelagomonas_calceolata.AAC.24